MVDASAANALDARLTHACSTLESVVGCLSTVRGDGEDELPRREGGNLDGGVLLAFENTICRVLDRIDKLTTTDALWRVAPGSRKLARREAESRTQVVEEASSSISDGNRPSHKYRVELAALEGGHFVALLRLKDGSVLAGYGESAAEAMADFDRVWTRRRPDYTPLPEPIPPRMVGPKLPDDDESPESEDDNPPPDPAEKTA